MDSHTQVTLQDALAEELTWKAVLPTDEAIGFDTSINLFDYLGIEDAIKFDPLKYPPNKDGRKELLEALKAEGNHHGSDFTVDITKGRLLCNLGRKYRPKDDKNNEKDDNNGTPAANDENKFDANGVLEGIRRHQYHNDRLLNRSEGHRGKKRASCTRKDLTGEHLCRCKLTFRFKVVWNPLSNKSEELIVMSHLGQSTHTFHPRTEPGEIAIRKQNLKKDVCEVITNGHNAAFANTSSRKFILETKNSFVTKSTHRTIIECSPEFLKASGNGVGSSSAAELIEFFHRSNSGGKKLYFKILSYVGQAAAAMFRNPKGRPSRENPHPSGVAVAQSLSYVTTHNDVNTHVNDTDSIIDNDTESNVGDTGSDIEGELITTHNVEPFAAGAVINESSYEVNGQPRQEVNERVMLGESMMQLVDQSRQRLTVLQYPGTARSRVMLGAVWMRHEDYCLFRRFPEVLVIDATHKTNNEGRPLLLVCGKDSDGNAFVILRIFMPNETLAFFRWVFLDVFPSLLGKEDLKRVQLVLTDGDSQEFNALDESIFTFISNAKRGRCGYHLVEKSYQKYGPSVKQFRNETVGKAIEAVIKDWVRSWINGSSCGTLEQYELSKAMLVHTLMNNREIRAALGDAASESIVQWILERIECHGTHFEFHMKRKLMCFDEWTTNGTEGMNNQAKNSGMSSAPNTNMSTSAARMNAQADMKSREKRHRLITDSTKTPLFIDFSCGHDLLCSQRLSSKAFDMLIRQFEERSHYEVLWFEPSKFVVIRSSVQRKLYKNCPASFRGPPQFLEAHTVDVVSTGSPEKRTRTLVCSCGFKHRYGVVCRHLLAIEPKYDLWDIHCRWQTAYALCAYEKGKEDITNSYIDVIKSGYNDGITVKSQEIMELMDGCHDLSFPRKIVTGTGEDDDDDNDSQWNVRDMLAVYNSSVPMCWNYSRSDYPPNYGTSRTGNQTDMMLFTQESFEPDGNNDALLCESEEDEADGYSKDEIEMDRSTKLAMILQKTKDLNAMASTLYSMEALNKLYDGLSAIELEAFRNQVAALPARKRNYLLGNEGDIVSFSAPFDNQRKSTQQTYKRRR